VTNPARKSLENLERYVDELRREPQAYPEHPPLVDELTFRVCTSVLFVDRDLEELRKRLAKVG
jgi:hypothetical protein